MSYRCEVCNDVRARGTPRLTHALLKPCGDIERELSVCLPCKKALEAGHTPASLARAARLKREEKGENHPGEVTQVVSVPVKLSPPKRRIV